MGQSIHRTAFSREDHQRFARQLHRDLETLEALLATPGWGVGPRTLGAELELYLTDPKGRPVPRNQEVLALAGDPLLTEELNRFNLEYNCPYTECQGAPFSWLREKIDHRLSTLRDLVAPKQILVTPIGILPTLTEDDFGLHSMTDTPRYHALTQILTRARGGPFQICISGTERLVMSADDMTLEGANTSFQMHLKVAPAEFAAWYNAIQIASAFALALGANSPVFLGRRLWHETRVPLFKQSIDCRNLCQMNWQPPARVSFGKGYVRSSALELFRQGVSLQPVLLPECDETETVKPGCGPALSALRLHHGTVWSWNRAVYDDAGGGHLRIELRSLPAGPTSLDMLANGALTLGLAQALMPELDRLMDTLPFEFAEYNFYRAAQRGIHTQLLWPNGQGNLDEIPVLRLLPELVDKAEQGLFEMGIDVPEAATLMAVQRERVERKQTGATWQLSCLERLEANSNRQEALSRMFAHYRRHSDTGEPVARWSCP
ncbi:glutamate--cysteine ligase [Ferrimonas balearica]|uniref:glutamate--cysteine ligase n=1 Tax=Ferrimonas balearica TaxID=44012 RepID=UPI001C991BE9|nr:glutamate--cysteine ligase [Ferrimonas balearica]MBY5920897.1 glutamate--cysteine ligase [Ferrimonas balearica]MBY5996418.1 glutamate--cysteine ligase [Ferrimonas balearica]